MKVWKQEKKTERKEVVQYRKLLCDEKMCEEMREGLNIEDTIKKIDVICTQSNDPDRGTSANDVLISSLQKIGKKACGSKMCGGKPGKSWIDNSFKDLWKTKTRLHRLLKELPHNSLTRKQLFVEYLKMCRDCKRLQKKLIKEEETAEAEKVNRDYDNEDKDFWGVSDRLSNNRDDLTVECIRDDDSGEIISDPEQMAQKFHSHYDKLANVQLQLGYFTYFEPLTQTGKLNNTLAAPITTPEYKFAVDKLSNGKAPGPDDGIPGDFYKHWWRSWRTVLF